jgi:hypothetical protein
MSENITQILDEPNNEITVDEILKAVHLLKNGKSASADLISNEMLKKAVPVLLKPLHKLFNFIISNFFLVNYSIAQNFYFYTVFLLVYIIF